MGGKPVRDHKAFEALLAPEDFIKEDWIFASIDLIDLIVRAHHGCSARFDRVSERLKIELVEGSVVQVGKTESMGNAFSVSTTQSLGLLLVCNVVLDRSLNALTLDAADQKISGNASKERVRRKAFPVAPPRAFRPRGPQTGLKFIPKEIERKEEKVQQGLDTKE